MFDSRGEGIITWSELSGLLNALGMPTSIIKASSLRLMDIEQLPGDSIGLTMTVWKRLSQHPNFLNSVSASNSHVGERQITKLFDSVLYHLASGLCTIADVRRLHTGVSFLEAGVFLGVPDDVLSIGDALQMAGKAMAPKLVKKWKRATTFDVPGRVQLYELLVLYERADDFDKIRSTEQYTKIHEDYNPGRSENGTYPLAENFFLTPRQRVESLLDDRLAEAKQNAVVAGKGVRAGPPDESGWSITPRKPKHMNNLAKAAISARRTPRSVTRRPQLVDPAVSSTDGQPKTTSRPLRRPNVISTVLVPDNPVTPLVPPATLRMDRQRHAARSARAIQHAEAVRTRANRGAHSHAHRPVATPLTRGGESSFPVMRYTPTVIRDQGSRALGRSAIDRPVFRTPSSGGDALALQRPATSASRRGVDPSFLGPRSPQPVISERDLVSRVMPSQSTRHRPSTAGPRLGSSSQTVSRRIRPTSARTRRHKTQRMVISGWDDEAPPDLEIAADGGLETPAPARPPHPSRSQHQKKTREYYDVGPIRLVPCGNRPGATPGVVADPVPVLSQAGPSVDVDVPLDLDDLHHVPSGGVDVNTAHKDGSATVGTGRRPHTALSLLQRGEQHAGELWYHEMSASGEIGGTPDTPAHEPRRHAVLKAQRHASSGDMRMKDLHDSLRPKPAPPPPHRTASPPVGRIRSPSPTAGFDSHDDAVDAHLKRLYDQHVPDRVLRGFFRVRPISHNR